MLETLVADGVLGLYRLAGRAGGPLIRGHLRRRAERGREDLARIGERFGYPGARRPPGALAWLHGRAQHAGRLPLGTFAERRGCRAARWRRGVVAHSAHSAVAAQRNVAAQRGGSVVAAGPGCAQMQRSCCRKWTACRTALLPPP